MGPSPLYHVSCRMTMSVFEIYLMKSGFLLFRPLADDLRPCIFQDEIYSPLSLCLCLCLSSDMQLVLVEAAAAVTPTRVDTIITALM